MEHHFAMASDIVGEPFSGRRAQQRTNDAREEVPATMDVEGLFRDNHVRLERLAAAVTLDRSLAEDIVQEAFSGLYRRRADVSNPEGYLQRSVVNLSIKAQRRRATARNYRPEPQPVTGIPEVDETWAAVCGLPARQRAVVALRFWDDLSEADIADALDWPAGTVKSTLHRALARLKKEITR